ncbi:HNH endonuclease signature motif containing protein [Marinobacter shengliensis]|uniref:HNH endonuclease signature motif containing protein n=1 Tax=Marinobacter shengliensis TaxID=1389223 RepID=UPI001E614498|nr:HNH endonuclease signature motif containing protein [Marinobacter shengliensis]MCD1628455.1 HNH endonuclease [Marinobacter shengliensis]
MADFIEDTDSGIYRITREGKVFTQTKRKIPLVGKGMEFTGEFKIILEPEREMSYTLNNRGYLSVVVRRKTHMLHRLVAQAFIPNPEGKPFVNHKDGNKLNNHVDNLEWCTAAENNQHARATGLHKQARGHKVQYQSAATKQKALSNLKDKSKLTPDDVRYVRQVHVPRSKEYSATALAERFGTSVAAMSKIVRGESYKDIE